MPSPERRVCQWMAPKAGIWSRSGPSHTGLEATYNLIVADFHTYFVGEGKILSHDNTIREPTVALVPGLKGDVR